ncbi:hypothetical protein ABTL27_20395, partial [Acinetobacter baumannii]
DASSHPPRLRRAINLGPLAELPPAARGGGPPLAEQLALLKADGHEAAQVWQPSAEAARAVLDAGLAVTGICRALLPAEV